MPKRGHGDGLSFNDGDFGVADSGYACRLYCWFAVFLVALRAARVAGRPVIPWGSRGGRSDGG